jgi:hypothetical protein
MKKYLVLFLIISSCCIGCKTIHIGNNTEAITATIKYKKIDSCDYYCYIAELYLKNNTPDSIYLWSKIMSMKNIYNRSIKKKYLKKMEIYDYCIVPKNHEKKSHFESTCRIPPKNFLEEAEKRELFLFCEHNNLSLNDSIAIRKNAFNTEFKYKYPLFFLEPYEECLVNVYYLDVFVNKKIKLSYSFDWKKSDSLEWEDASNIYKKSKRPVGKMAEYNNTYFDKIAGYKLFNGTIRSNILIVKRGKILKDIPKPKVVKFKKYFNE